MIKEKTKKITQTFKNTVGASALLKDKAMASVANMQTGKDTEKSRFLSNYENWVNQYIRVVEKGKSTVNKQANKHRIMGFAHQAKNWQEKIALYLNDDTFKRRYIQLSMRLSDGINSNSEV